jgi:hypothetical protein
VHEEGVEPSRFYPPEPKAELSGQEQAGPREIADLDTRTRTSEREDRPLAHVVAHLEEAVEIALADALVEAARAKRWDMVAKLASELEARRSST